MRHVVAMGWKKEIAKGAREKIVAILQKYDLDYEYDTDEQQHMVVRAVGMSEEVMRELVCLQFKYRMVREVRVGTNYVAFHA